MDDVETEENVVGSLQEEYSDSEEFSERIAETGIIEIVKLFNRQDFYQHMATELVLIVYQP